MLVKELLHRKSPSTITVDPGASAATAVRLLTQHNIGGLPVVDRNGTLAGFLAERDIVRALAARETALDQLRVDAAMQRPAPLCRSDDPLQEVMSRMTRERLRHLVVLDGTHISGVISVGDIVKHRLEQLETETGVLRDYVAARRAVT